MVCGTTGGLLCWRCSVDTWPMFSDVSVHVADLAACYSARWLSEDCMSLAVLRSVYVCENIMLSITRLSWVVETPVHSWERSVGFLVTNVDNRFVIIHSTGTHHWDRCFCFICCCKVIHLYLLLYYSDYFKLLLLEWRCMVIFSVCHSHVTSNVLWWNVECTCGIRREAAETESGGNRCMAVCVHERVFAAVVDVSVWFVVVVVSLSWDVCELIILYNMRCMSKTVLQWVCVSLIFVSSLYDSMAISHCWLTVCLVKKTGVSWHCC